MGGQSALHERTESVSSSGGRPVKVRKISLCVGAVLGVLFQGCAGPVPTEHIVMFDFDGRPIDPSQTGWFGAWIGGYGELSEADDDESASETERRFDAYVDRIIDGIRRYSEEENRRKVLLFIHGGLNSQAASIDRARQLAGVIRDGRHEKDEARCYPIFVNWRSNLVNSYVNHLFFVRQGHRLFGRGSDAGDIFLDSLSFLLFPFRFAADVARGVARTPLVQLHQLGRATEWLGLGRSPAREAAEKAIRRHAADSGEHPDAGFAIQNELDLPADSPAWESVESVFGTLEWFVMSPVKVVSTMAVDTGGTGAWEVMRRRVDLLFHREDDFDGLRLDRQSRGLLFFMERLRALQEEYEVAHRAACHRPEHSRCGHALEISIVGHSMGTIVLNQLLLHATQSRAGEGAPCGVGCGKCALGPDAADHAARSAPVGPGVRPSGAAPTGRLPRFKNLVYLAAACSLGEYQDAAFRYLRHEPEARVYHVVLHPDNESGENFLYDLTPRGSLLSWVDDFLARPLTTLDRTAGSFDNLLPGLYETPRALRRRIHVRVLPWAVDGLPQRHGDFSGALERFRFWDPECWYGGVAPE